MAQSALRGDTLFTQRWSHGALHDYLPGLNSHVIMTYDGAARDIHLQREGQRLSAKTAPGTITLIPDGQDGRWDIGGKSEVSHVYLPDVRLREFAEQLTGSKPIELIGRVGFEDQSAARILELLSREAVVNDPASRYFPNRSLICCACNSDPLR